MHEECKIFHTRNTQLEPLDSDRASSLLYHKFQLSVGYIF